MTQAVTFKTEIGGLRRLKLVLKLLDDEILVRTGNYALGKTALVIKQGVVENLAAVDREKTPEEIYRNVAVRMSPLFFKDTGDLKARVGVLDSDTKAERQTHPGGDTFYYRFLELGTEHVPAYRPITRGGFKKAPLALPVFVSYFRRGLKQALRSDPKINAAKAVKS